jgi:hypothetical protein
MRLQVVVLNQAQDPLNLLFYSNGKKLKLSLCLTNYALRHEGAWRSGCTDPHFLDFGTS